MHMAPNHEILIQGPELRRRLHHGGVSLISMVQHGAAVVHAIRPVMQPQSKRKTKSYGFRMEEGSQ